MSQQPVPISSLDDDVALLLDLTERMEELDSQRNVIKQRIRLRGLGRYETSSGLTVTVTAPARRFNLDKAWGLLNAEQQAVCVSPDAKKVKAQLAPAITESLMEPGTGQDVVKLG